MTFWNSPDIKPFQKFKFKLLLGDEVIWQVKSVELPKLSMTTHEVKYGLSSIRKWAKSPYIWKPIKIEIVDVQRDDGFSTSTELFYLLYKTHYMKELAGFEKADNKIKAFNSILNNMNQNFPISKNYLSYDNLINDGAFDNSRIGNVGVSKSGKIEKIEIHKHFMGDSSLHYVRNDVGQYIQAQKALETSEILNEVWILENCLLIDVDFGNVDYSSEELNHISLTLQPEWCRLQNSEGRTKTTDNSA